LESIRDTHTADDQEQSAANRNTPRFGMDAAQSGTDEIYGLALGFGKQF